MKVSVKNGAIRQFDSQDPQIGATVFGTSLGNAVEEGLNGRTVSGNSVAVDSTPGIGARAEVSFKAPKM